MIRGRNAGNVFDVLAMAYEAVCFPGRFAATIDMWGNMVTQDHARSMALNVLLTLPPIVLVSKCTFWMCFDLSNMHPEQIYEAGLIQIFIHFSQCLVPTSAAAFAICCMIIDDAGANQWSETPVPETDDGLPAGIPYVRDIVAFSFFMACFFFVVYWEYFPGIMLLIITFSMTVSFASCVARIIEKVRGIEEGALKQSRMWSTMVFAFRYSCLFHICTAPMAVKGIIVLRLVKHSSLRRVLKLNYTVEETECFIAMVPPSIFVALGAVVTALDHMAITNGDEDWSMALYGWYSSAAVLVFINIFTHVVYYCGKETGEAIYVEGESMRNLSNERIQSYNLVPSQRPSITGIFAFALTVFYMLFLVCV
jgi:hypothetical protein